MKALGLVETRGLIAAIEACDVMLKTAEVQLHSKELVGGGLVTITVLGDVGAVKTSVDAASMAVRTVGNELLCSTHVIPRPDDRIGELFLQQKEVKEIIPSNEAEIELEIELVEVSEADDEDANVQANELTMEKLAVEEITAELLREWFIAGEAQRSIGALNSMRVVDLRKLAKKQPEFGIAQKDIYRTNKEKLIESLINYFNKN